MNTNPTTHPAHARELAREMREHDEKVTPAPWADTDNHDGSEGLLQVMSGIEPISTSVCIFCDMEECEAQDLDNAKFIAWMRNNAAFIATTLDALADECEKLRAFPARHQVFAWLGYWRDHMPAEAVKQLQDALGPLFETSDAMQTDS